MGMLNCVQRALLQLVMTEMTELTEVTEVTEVTENDVYMFRALPSDKYKKRGF